MARIYVDRYNGRIERTDLYRVRLTMKKGGVYEDLEPRRLFPITNQTMLCFAEYYMIPKISRLLECEDKFGSLKWTVDTDYGRVTFRIRNRHSDIKRLGHSNRIIIRDSNDNRYEIPDCTDMDPHSIHLLFSYL